MIWWDFTNRDFIIFFVILVIASAFLLGMIISIIVSSHLDRGRRKKINDESRSSTIYIIDFKNNNVIEFTRATLREKKTMTLSQFYLHFAKYEVDKIKNWLYAICVENSSTDDYLEVDVVGERSNSYYSILKCIKYSDEEGLLHLESRVLRYISTNLEVSKDKWHKNGKVPGRLTSEEMKGIIQSQKILKGYCFCVRYFYKKIGVIDDSKVEKVIIANLKDVVYSFANSAKTPRLIIDEPANEIFLFDLTLEEQEDAVSLVANISHELKRNISINGLDEDIGFAIGAVGIAQYYQDYNAIIKTSQQACIYAQQHNLNSYFYLRSSKLILSETGIYSQEISRLLKPHSLSFTYRAIINALEGEIIGYFSYVTSARSPFANLMEMFKYSAKVHRNREFFAYVSKNVISRFISETKPRKLKLFMQVSLSDISFILEVINNIPDVKECSLVLEFEERDFDDEEMELSMIETYFKELKDEGIELSLMMHDQNLLLDPAVYALFDYFTIGSSMVKEIKRNKMTRLSIHNIAEQLLKYKKPIIASDIEGWVAIELIVNSGIVFISSETISQTNSMILPLDTKKIDKLVTITGNYQ